MQMLPNPSAEFATQVCAQPVPLETVGLYLNRTEGVASYFAASLKFPQPFFPTNGKTVADNDLLGGICVARTDRYERSNTCNRVSQRLSEF
jgi:hypothetical protein